MKYVPIIGLEVHIQLKTKTKMFCDCKNEDAAAPNTNVCPICLGHPGALPVPNKKAVEQAIRMAKALGCKINHHSKFDRKNYFYPDLPKGYQISQFDLPIAEGGDLVINVPEESGGRGEVRIGITRLHLEEDAAKNIHSDDKKETYVDYNRGGAPLAEMVSEPDLRSPAEAKAYLQEVRLIARTLGISDADMEKGHLRCDANISLRRFDDDGNMVGDEFNQKTEIKNLNSFRMVERALEYEIGRQTDLWEDGKPPMVASTRGWDDEKSVTTLQRSKEDSAEYRYFPEPDIPRLDLSGLDEELAHLPELPAEKRLRFEEEYGLAKDKVHILVGNVSLSVFAERVFSELLAWLNALPRYGEMDESERASHTKTIMRTSGTWLLDKWVGLLNARKLEIEDANVTPENFAELMVLVVNKDVTANTALHILEVMTATGKDPTHVMEDEGLGRVEDAGEIADVVVRVLEHQPIEVERYHKGEEKLLKFFLGIVMKETQGKADPGIAENMLKVELEKRKG